MTRIPFDPDAIRSLAAILEEKGLTELELHEGETRLRLVRAVSQTVQLAAPPPQVALVAPPPPPAGEAPPPAGAVPSPMVGIAYLSAEPGTPPFVAPGQTVAAGQTLLLIEAMKTFNQIKAPRAGTVTQILVATGQPVEYGQPLVVIA